MSLLHAIDGGEISLEIDVDQGGRISSLRFRDIECVLPFRGQVLTWGWYPMAPWAGRIKDGLIKNSIIKKFKSLLNSCSKIWLWKIKCKISISYLLPGRGRGKAMDRIR